MHLIQTDLPETILIYEARQNSIQYMARFIISTSCNKHTGIISQHYALKEFVGCPWKIMYIHDIYICLKARDPKLNSEEPQFKSNYKYLGILIQFFVSC